MARYSERPSITFRDVQTIFRTNFRGEPSQYNKDGRKEFNVVVETEELANQLIADGWNVKHTKVQEEGDEPTYYLPVTVAYENFPPEIYMIDELTKRRTLLDDATVGLLDTADITKINLEVSGYNWNVNGRSGIKAYVRRLNAFVRPNPFADDFEEEEVPFQ